MRSGRRLSQLFNESVIVVKVGGVGRGGGVGLLSGKIISAGLLILLFGRF